MIITEKAVFKVSENDLELIEMAMGQSIDKIKKATGDTFSVAKNLKEF
jgi:acyl CoA:acetate/3-ketoacid CoA transferase beta subunit